MNCPFLGAPRAPRSAKTVVIAQVALARVRIPEKKPPSDSLGSQGLLGCREELRAAARGATGACLPPSFPSRNQLIRLSSTVSFLASVDCFLFLGLGGKSKGPEAGCPHSVLPFPHPPPPGAPQGPSKLKYTEIRLYLNKKGTDVMLIKSGLLHKQVEAKNSIERVAEVWCSWWAMNSTKGSQDRQKGVAFSQW